MKTLDLIPYIGMGANNTNKDPKFIQTLPGITFMVLFAAHIHMKQTSGVLYGTRIKASLSRMMI